MSTPFGEVLFSLSLKLYIQILSICLKPLTCFNSSRFSLQYKIDKLLSWLKCRKLVSKKFEAVEFLRTLTSICLMIISCKTLTSSFKFFDSEKK